MSRHRGVSYRQPGRHWWSFKRDVSLSAGKMHSVFVCKVCGVEVSTPSGFPTCSVNEVWDGQRILKNHPRPKCKEAA